jgi:DNA (cytosine-5)-methyltransferase 1
MKGIIRHLELFAGIGGFRKAIDLFAKDNNLQSKCIGYSELDKYANMTYQANYDTSEEVLLGDISKFTSDKSNIENLPDFDFLSGGFPCQSFSMMGKQLGLDDKRGNLFYDIIEILKVKKPKYVLLENVRNLKTHDKGNTYKEVLRSLEEDANYYVSADIFNTADFGLPQNRRRIFIFAVRKDLSMNNPLLQFDFRVDKVRSHLKKLNGSATLKRYDSVLDGILEKSVDEKYYLSERIKPTILADGSKNFKSKSEINQLIARPLTATMVKMHRACQDNYYSDDFLLAENPNEFLKNSFSKEELAKKPIRKLTPLEAFRLQGFDEQFCKKAQDAGVSNHQLYRQAGNAVSVNTVYSILSYLYKTQKIEF